MNKRAVSPAQARHRSSSAPKFSWKLNRMWLGQAMAFVAVFSLVLSSVSPTIANTLNPIAAKTAQAIALPPIPTTTVVVTGNTSVSENSPGWMFNRDASTATPYAFDNAQSSIGSGSLHILPIGANASDKMVAENFINTPITNVNGISYDFKIGAGGLATQEEQFYMSIYANFGVSDDFKFYDCRYTVLPTIGSNGSFTTVSFDPNVAPYSVATRGGANASPFACPAIPADMNTLSAGSNIRMFSLSVGDTSASDVGLDGYLDKVVVSTPSLITTYDFEPAPPRVPITVDVRKVWQDAGGNIIPAPTGNNDDITITATVGNNIDVCKYNAQGVLACDGPINTFAGDQINIVETGLPAGWEVVPGTVGNVIPVCPQTVEQGEICVHNVINKLKTASPCGNELVANGGFEFPEVTDSNQWQVFDSGSATLGWSADWVRPAGAPAIAKAELHEGVNGWTAHGGNQHTEIDSDWAGPSSGPDGEDASVKLYQDLITKVGGVYTVSLWTSPRPGTGTSENRTEVKMGAVVLDTIVEDGSANSLTVWTKHTYTFTAIAGVTRLTLTDLGTGNSLGAFLDDVSVKEDCISDVTICKVDQNQNPLSGWDVFLKGPKVETVVVSGTSNVAATSAPLAAGDYLLEASGTYTYRAGSAGDISDAAYSERQPSDAGIDASFYSGAYLPWVRNLDLGAGYGGYLGIRVDGANFNWGSAYHSNHEYSAFKNVAALAPLSFYIEDGNSYADNAGSLSVDISPVVKGTTGQNGCVTLQDVDYGTYKLDELMKDGWVNLSGKDTTAVIDLPTETFTLTNQCTNNCNSTVKICKVNDQGTPLSGWNVFLKGPKLETVDVDSDEVAGSTTSNVLTNGQQYVVDIEGEWTNRPGETVDASYSTMNNWTTPLAGPDGGYPDDLLETQINNAFVNWGPYSNTHAYSTVITGAGATANFRVFDGDANTNTQIPSWFADNVGHLTVKIYPIFQGTTGANGCVTIAGVPFGTYTLGETMQEGWINERGNGSTVIVNEPSEPGTNLNENPFILVNACTGNGCQDIVPCTVTPISVISGAATFFEGLKEGGPAPLTLNNANNYPAGTTGVAQPAGPTGYAGAWDGSINDPDIAGSGAVYVSNDSVQPTFSGGAGHNGSVDSWRLFKHTFTIPAGATNVSMPVLHFAADNEVTAFLDEVQIGFNNSFAVATDTAPLALTPGTHTLEFAVKNYAFDQTNNPTGVIYKLDTITYQCPPTTVDTFSVNGLVYTDDDHDNTQDEGELPLEGMTVKLIKATADGADDGTDLDETETATDVSDANGLYQFDGVLAGCYIVREIPGGYVQTEPATNSFHEYYINVGGSDCDFDAPNSKSTSLFFKTANAASASTVFVAYNNEQLKFGNYTTSGGGGGGGNGGGNNGGNTPDDGSVAGDSTDIPFIAPQGQVLGAVTLPVTGSPTWVLLVLALVAIPLGFFRKFAVQKNI